MLQDPMPLNPFQLPLETQDRPLSGNQMKVGSSAVEHHLEQAVSLRHSWSLPIYLYWLTETCRRP